MARSGVGQQLGSAFAQPRAAVLGRCSRGGCRELSCVFEVAVGTAGKAEVGVVELTESRPEWGLKPSVDVLRHGEPLFGLVVLAKHRGGASERPGDGTANDRTGSEDVGRERRKSFEQ